MPDQSELEVFEKHIPKSNWDTVLKVSIKFVRFPLLDLKIFRRYYLQITFKSGETERIYLSTDQKEIVKKQVTGFNFYLTTSNLPAKGDNEK